MAALIAVIQVGEGKAPCAITTRERGGVRVETALFNLVPSVLE